MNVVYLHTHDLGDWLSVYGREVETPHMDELFHSSTQFGNAFAAAPTCSPSRAALLTGQCAHSAGMMGLAHRGFSMSKPQHHLANVLRENGFETVLSGIQHEFSGGGADGFPYETVIGQIDRPPEESHDTFQARRDREIAEAAADWLHQRSSSGDFFLSVGFFQPHRPFPRRDAIDDPQSMRIPPILPDKWEVKEDFANLRTSIRLLDHAFGIVVNALKATGHWDNSIILFTTDHGIAFPMHKCRLSDGGTKVALALRHPHMPQFHGKRIDTMVSHLDVVPTIYSWLGLPVPDWCEGYPLQPVIAGSQPAVRTHVFSEVNYHAAYEPMRSVRTDRHCLIRRYDNCSWRLANIDDSPSKDAWCSDGFHTRFNPTVGLYDMASDPHQLNNLADQMPYRAIQSALEAALDEWMKQTDDPLLRGPIPRPEHSIVNHPDSTSPYERYYVDSMAMQD